MRESLGGSMLLNLVVIFASLIIVVFVGILSYSKAYKIKNRIIEMIEKYSVYEEKESDYDISYVEDEINPDLSAAGYDVSTPTKCDNVKTNFLSKKYDLEDLSGNLNNHGYNYCVFRNDGFGYGGSTYIVVTFIRFEVPIIADVLTFPVYGETKILGKDYNY